MIPVPEAIELIRKDTPALAAVRVPLEESVGRVLREDVVADSDLPPFNRAQMDGFAVRSKDTLYAPAELKIIGESVAGRGFDTEVGAREAVRIMTGARVPEGADAVQKVEVTKDSDGVVSVLEKAEHGLNIVKKGEEVRAGQKVFQAGEPVNEHTVATLASFGYAEVSVGASPRVSILSTGTEIVPVEAKPERDQIRNSNSSMLGALCRKFGAVPTTRPHADDDLEGIKSAIAAAIAENPDVLIITGGVSVGDYDFTKPALRELGAEIIFEKVSLKPGKPTVFAKLGETLIFGLPGNPVSVAVTFYLFVRGAMLAMQGARETALREGFAIASKDFKGAKERDCFLPVSLTTDLQGHVIIDNLRFAGSSNFIAFARAEALLFVPKGTMVENGGIGRIYYLR